MEFSEVIQEAINTLTVNKLRTFLATLGIVIGIGSVIALISLGQGTQKSVENQIQSLGSNLLTVSPGSSRGGFVQGGAGSATTLTYEDAKAITTSSQITTINNVSPELSRRTQVTASGNNTNTQVIGATSIYSEVHKVSISSGNFLTQYDIDGQAKVAVLGPQVVTDLFGEGTNPVGSSIRISGQSFRVIGVTVSKGGTGFPNQDDVIYVPITTAQKSLFGTTSLTSIAVQAKSEEVMVQAQDEVGYLLLERHRLSDPTQADFSIFSQNDILNTASSVTGTFTALLSGIAAISLVVGGIGIMHIMLVTVTERTREIGLRKALGATRMNIMMQFLIEALTLCLLGGLIGVLLGIGTAVLLSTVMHWNTLISPMAVGVAFAFSAAVGLFFGIWPAGRASR